MAIALTEENLPARMTKQGSGIVTMSAGERLRVRTNPPGTEILDEIVPAGKSWQVSINVYIVEIDA